MNPEELQKKFNNVVVDIGKRQVKRWLETRQRAENNTEKATRNRVFSDADALPRLTSDLAEVLTCITLGKLFPGSDVDYKLNSTRFPDIVIEDTGYEVKQTSSLSSGMLGNSVLQNDPGQKRIYAILFGDNVQNGVLIKDYEDLISSVKVDHNPRFFLSLDSDSNKFTDFFNYSLAEFLALSKQEKSALLKEYLRRNTTEDNMWLWYMGLRDSELLEIMLEGVEMKWKELDKQDLRVKVFAEKPEIISSEDYSGLRDFIVQEYQCWGPIKDVFTAGRNSKHDKYPKIFMHLRNNLGEIKTHLLNNQADLDDWKKKIVSIISQKVGKPSNQNGLSEEQAQEIVQAINDI